jgi:hypothetical protein
MRVETARGAMAVDGLGTTLMHEQVFVLTPDVEWILRAVGQTHVETGTPIIVHTSAALKTGLIAQRIPKEEGVDLTKVESATAVIRPTSTCCPRCANTASTKPRSRRCWSTTPPATSPEARSEPNGSYRDSPHAQPLSASGCSG